MARKTDDKYKLLFEIAESQQGLFTARQAEKVGYIRTNHAYHVKVGNWVREERGIYRLSYFPYSTDQQLVTYALWSHNIEGETQGIFSHETALAIHELTDLMPAKLHMSVPKRFRRNSEIPKILRLYYQDISKKDLQNKRGFMVTTPLKTIRDIIESNKTSLEFIEQAIHEALKRGLVSRKEIKELLANISVDDSIRKHLNVILKEAA